jgi:hypothetical protein
MQPVVFSVPVQTAGDATSSSAAYQLEPLSQGPKKYRFPGPNPLPLVLVMDAARIKSTGPYNVSPVS